MVFTDFLYIAACYLVGAIPFGIIMAYGTGVDIRNSGSRNIGATNVARLLGKKRGALTLLFDILKGFVPIYVAAAVMKDQPNANLVTALCGGATFIGHMFPVYLKFKGGKGVATALGVFLFLSPVAIIGCLAVFIGAVYFSGFVSVGSLLGSASVIIWLWLLGAPGWKTALAVFIVVMIWLKHHQNIGRLLTGTEKSWKKKSD